MDQTVTDLPALQETWVRTLGQEESPGEGKQLPIPRWPGGRNGKPVQYSCLQSLVNRGAWRATLHGVTESDTTQQLTYTMPLKSWSAGKVRRRVKWRQEPGSEGCYCSITELCPTLCDPVDSNMPGFSVLHYLVVCSNSCPSNR